MRELKVIRKMEEGESMEIETEKPLASIVVPIYNVEKFLHRCVDSLLSQTYHNIEIICKR